MGTRILLIHLGALGAVLRSTALLGAIKRRWPESFIVWLTEPAAQPLLEHNPLIDQVLTYTEGSIQSLLAQEFDVVMNVDKSQPACGLASRIQAKKKFGFGLLDNGAIVPFNREAESLYRLGLDDEAKFSKNKLTENQLICEALALPYARDEYILQLTSKERAFIEAYKERAGISKRDVVIGFNTGCSDAFPLKRLPLSQQLELIQKVHVRLPHAKLVLLGGREDTEMNEAIQKRLGSLVISTPTTEGLRRGILYADLCSTVVTGDTLGLHMAIALKKKVVVWFGLSCDNEIELYGQGIKILSSVACRPCWKRDCEEKVLCNESVDLDEIADAVVELNPK